MTSTYRQRLEESIEPNRNKRSTRAITAFFDNCRCPPQKRTLKHVLPTVISACDNPRIKEYRDLRSLDRRRLRWWQWRLSGSWPPGIRFQCLYIWGGRGDDGEHIPGVQGATIMIP